jgi:PncC family amidohydrolase
MMITSEPGSSRYFTGGVVAYDNLVKRKLLGVSSSVLERHGAVSIRTVKSMAEGVRKLFGTDCSIAVSGIAGPGGGSKGRPVGHVCFAAAFRNMTRTTACRFSGSRNQIRKKASLHGLLLLMRLLGY